MVFEWFKFSCGFLDGFFSREFLVWVSDGFQWGFEFLVEF